VVSSPIADEKRRIGSTGSAGAWLEEACATTPRGCRLLTGRGQKHVGEREGRGTGCVREVVWRATLEDIGAAVDCSVQERARRDR
jgi:hypothetical protein